MKIVDYIKDTKAELTHVNWPKRRQASLFTILVLILSAVGALYLGVLDSVFKVGIERILGI